MVPKRIAMKSFADFVAGTKAGKRATLRRYKYPGAEGRAMATYYHRAKLDILEFIRDEHSVEWLLVKAHELEQLSLTPNKLLRSKLLNNARAVRSYAEHFAGLPFQLMPPQKFPFHLNGVTINVTPDIHVLDDSGNQRYITFSFGQKKMKHTYVRTLLHCMSYGVFTHSQPPTSATFINVATGTVHSGVHVTPDLIAELSTQCGEVQATWDAL